jgi:hypothetical protein
MEVSSIFDLFFNHTGSSHNAWTRFSQELYSNSDVGSSIWALNVEEFLS